jgi:two-component system, cell cycle response regulator DivK
MGVKSSRFFWPDKIILIAEDLSINYKLIEIALRKTQAKLVWAKNGLEAITIFTNNPTIDLILMDIQMPEMDGYEATRRIRETNKNVPIIAQTAYAMSGEKENSISAGCTSYISKPIRRDTLYEVIEEFIHWKEIE